MSKTNLNALGKTLVFAAVVEIGTGLILMIDPAIIAKLLLGADLSGVAALLGRCFGIALLALGLACWPGRKHAGSGSPAFLGMLVYNMLIALFLAYVFVVDHLGGVLLWPGALLHAMVAIVLVWTWHAERATQSSIGTHP